MNIDKLLKMNYDELVDHLKIKYGKIPKSYFNSKGNKTQGITRGGEGLFIHHVDEDKMILLSNKKDEHPVVNQGMLSDDQVEKLYTDFQEAERLVYCNLLEHLLLHVKILDNPKPMIPQVRVGEGGIVNFMVPELNDIFSGIKYKQPWKLAVVKAVKGYKKEYLKILSYLLENNVGFGRDRLLSNFRPNEMIGWNLEKNEKILKKIKTL